jgi:hypothetical protein
MAKQVQLADLRIQPKMLNMLRSLITATVLTAGLLWLSVSPSYAKPEYATKEGQTCTYCHVAAGKPDLNDGGKYYATHDHSLKGYAPPAK